MENSYNISHVIREETLFASIRKPIKKRADLEPQVKILKEECHGRIVGPLTLIFHYDTPVEGFDAEIGFPVSEKVEKAGISSRILGRNEFLSNTHSGKPDKIGEAYQKVYGLMYKNGISPGMSTVEIFHDYDFDNPKTVKIEVQGSIHMWNYLYKRALNKYLGHEKQEKIYLDGDKITPFTKINDRIQWVKKTLERLKQESSKEEQFQILSHIALDRPIEEINQFKEKYLENHDVRDIINHLKTELQFIIEPEIKENYVHISKVARDREGYDKATNHDEKRKHYCFCRLVSEAASLPDIDPIFCYRAAGWAAQLWEEILQKPVIKCDIVKSVLKGDEVCDFKLYFDDKLV
ncbi:hypothetical protein NEF87_000051 [Candidatus Lokiarchaeum ossiferum]|uniref:Uncharacterized protein n=1 Tax=Candidatus Lokiarchaeum ossiferum TaxID=2951803 RepID=A0ABY6HJR0_9ARCH|nr:hypothetical protein NEF87_000051 [Candidatus Lokiarchaeum sp. B-35]